jgi:hypothetical protein
MSSKVVQRPQNLDVMLRVAEALSSFFGLIRIDLYSNDEQCVVGEITNCHGNAGERFIPLSGELVASEILFGAEWDSKDFLNSSPFIPLKRGR